MAAVRPRVPGASVAFLVADPEARAWAERIRDAAGNGVFVESVDVVPDLVASIDALGWRAMTEGRLTSAVLDEHLGGLRGHTLVLVGLDVAVLDDISLQAVRRSVFEQIYATASTAAAQHVHGKTACTVFSNPSPIAFVDGAPVVAVSGRPFYGARTSEVELRARRDSFLPGSVERVP